MAADGVTSYNDVPGWFNILDKLLFETLLESQAPLTGDGTLVEIGVYLGRSAVVMGAHKRPDERFVVVDLFGSDAELGSTPEDEANRRENKIDYPTLNRQQFEANYLALHPELPEVVAGLSSTIIDHVQPGTARFVHVDASHMYDKVAADISNTRTMLLPEGVVVLDDFRAQHTPGVAAATWEAVAQGLRPFALTERKMYATWGDPNPYLTVVRDVIDADPLWTFEEQPIQGCTVLRLYESEELVRRRTERRAAATAQKRRERQAAAADERTRLIEETRERVAKRTEKRVRDEIARQQQQTAAKRAARSAARSPWRKVTADLVPPALLRAVRRRRARARAGR